MDTATPQPMTPEQSQRPVDSEGRLVPVPEQLEVEATRVLGTLSRTESEDVIEGRAGSGLARDPAPETLEFASHVHQYHRDYISTADQKAAFVFVVASALLVYLYQQSFHLRWLKWFAEWSVGDLLTFLAMAALFVSLAAAASVVVPRLSTSHRGFIFFLSVSEYENASEYAASIVRERKDSLSRALLRHIYDLSTVARRKYKALAVAIWASVIGVGLSLIVLLFVGAS